MTTYVSPVRCEFARGLELNSIADTALQSAARLWFLVAVIGQLVFAIYVASFYGGAAVRGDLAGWNRLMPHGHVPGDTMGNFTVAMHLLSGVIIVACGALQFSPGVRDLAPSFHRWNGRVYLLSACAISIAALYMVWVRGSVGNLAQHLAISLNAVLIMLCAALALRYALAGKFAVHRRWAIRLFMVVSGVWFFRVGLMLLVFLTSGPAGFDPQAFQRQWEAHPGGSREMGAFLTYWSFADYLLPLAVLEIYLRIQDRAGALGRFAMAAGLFILTVAMGVGILAATTGMWLPLI